MKEGISVARVMTEGELSTANDGESPLWIRRHIQLKLSCLLNLCGEELWLLYQREDSDERAAATGQYYSGICQVYSWFQVLFKRLMARNDRYPRARLKPFGSYSNYGTNQLHTIQVTTIHLLIGEQKECLTTIELEKTI